MPREGGGKGTMDINGIKDLIVTVGFPILTSLICMGYVREQNKDARDEREKMYSELGEKIEQLNDSITKLTALNIAQIQKGGVLVDDLRN